MAVDMLQRGGLLTEYLTETNPDPYNFVSRNRIVAGMADATLVVESANKGGSLITADLANGYNRDCFALPGRSSDDASVGCNKLIRDNKAALILSAEDLVNAMGWQAAASPKPDAIQRNLFLDLSPEEERIVRTLQKKGDMHINALVVETALPINRISMLLFELEMKGVLKPLAGGVYHLLS